MAFVKRFKIYPLMKKGFLTNKYTLSVIILLTILATDILLHKGMSRTILPETFTGKRFAQADIPLCKQTLQIKGKNWLKAINNIAKANALDSLSNGIEIDVYFDTAQNQFFVYHDSSAMSKTTLPEILSVINQKKINISVWLDFKNLFEYNTLPSLRHLVILRNEFQLNNKLIIESPNLQNLQAFCDSGFYTSYYTPFFNPYLEDESAQIKMIDSMASLLKKYRVSALSGYYFQTAFLKKYFPVFPILTWTDDSKLSLVNNVFNKKLEADDNVKIILHPTDN